MKTILTIYLWLSYIVTAPFVLLLTIGILVWSAIENLRTFGELDIKGSAKALFSGYLEGHQINMANIRAACGEDECLEEETQQ